MMPKTPITPAGSPPPLAPYSPGVKCGNVVYVSGFLPIASDGNTFAPGDVSAQTRYILDKIQEVVEAAGGNMSDIAFNSIFLKDFADYAAMNAVYAEYFPKNHPARYCIRADLVREDFLVEISSIAHLSES